MKIKVNKHKLNIHYWGSLWGSRTQQHAYRLRYAHSHQSESHLGKKQRRAKIAIAFLFGQLHFNNVTSHALFYGGHLVMRSAKPGNHLKALRLRQLRVKLISRVVKESTDSLFPGERRLISLQYSEMLSISLRFHCLSPDMFCTAFSHAKPPDPRNIHAAREVTLSRF